MNGLTLGSLFDGIGVFPLAASRCGIRPLWASEIEAAPISITQRHFPDMAHLGDITKLDGGAIPPVHVREDGQAPEWCEGDAPISHGGSWMPSTGQGPGWPDASASFLWQTLEGGVLPKYCLSPAQCSHFLRLAQRAGCPPPAEIEALFLKQGGAYPSQDPFKGSVCGGLPRRGNKQRSKTASDFQQTLFPLC